VPYRISVRETEKWRAELTGEQVSDVMRFSEELMPLEKLEAPEQVPGATR
jgi:hypothetical protein